MCALKLKPLPLAISLAILLVYLLLPTRNYYWDGIGFAQAIEDAPGFSASLIHPNHLIYTAVGYLDYRLVQSIGIPVRSLTVLRVTNSILSAAAAYLFFEILLALFVAPFFTMSGSQWGSAILTLAFAFSATWWRFSTDANAYVPSVLLLLVAFRALLPGRPARPFLLAVAHTGAMLFHELAVLFYPAAVLGLLQQTSLLPLRQRLRAVIGYTSTAFLLTAGAYYAGFRWLQGDGAAAAAQPSVSSFIAWATSHSSESGFSSSLVSNTFLTLRSHLRLFLGGRPAMAFELSPRFTFAMIAAMAVFLAALAWELFRSRQQIQSCVQPSLGARQPFRASLSLAAAWAIPYLLFLFFWLPGNVFYRLFYLPALLLCVGIVFAGDEASASARPNTAYSAALLVALMAAANFTFDIVPNSRAASNPPLEFAQRMEQVFSPGTVVFFSNFNTDDWTIRYFNPATSWKKWEPPDLSRNALSRDELSSNALSVLDAELDRAGGTAWLDTTALEHLVSLPDGREWLQAHATDHGRLELVNSRARIVFQRITNPQSGQR